MKHLLLSAAIALPAQYSLAGEIYFSNTTGAAVARSLSSFYPEANSPDASIRFRRIAGPGLQETSAVGGIRLINATISQTTASAAGYPSFESESLTKAGAALLAASEYRYGLGQGGENSPWFISFGAVPYPANSDNFFPSKIDEAVEAARLAIRVNPYLTGAGSGYALLFQAAYEATVPYTYAGNEWRAKAERDRVAAEPSIIQRLEALNNAATQYGHACEALLKLLNHPSESAWLLDPSRYNDDAGPSWDSDDLSWSGLLYQAYVEAVIQLGQVEYERLYTRYLQDYGLSDLSSLTAEIHACANQIDAKVLPISALQSAGALDSDTHSEINTSSPGAWTSLLRRLADQVTERSVFFSPGVNPLSDKIAYTSYGPNYVPFLIPSQFASRPFSFDNFLGFTFGIDGDSVPPIDKEASSNSLIGVSINSDNDAMAAVDDQIVLQKNVEDLRLETQTKYFGQLVQLCGQRRSDPANPLSELVPDLIGYFLPPEERQPRMSGETHGDIALQWNKIAQAETRLFVAYRALAEIDEEADVIRQYGNERLLSYDRIAQIQLDTGEQISALDYLSGEIRAKALELEAEQRAQQQGKRDWAGACARFAAHAAAAYLSGGTSVIWSVAMEATVEAGDLMDEHRKAKSEAEMHRNIGQIQAEAARRQAEIEAQETRIRAMEAASITMELAGQEESNIREAIHKLMIRVERQKLEILFAKQQLEFAEVEHANMLGRISFLLEEYRRVTIRNAAVALHRPDVRLRRDYKIQEATRQFRVAQEYAFVCARAARYRFTGKLTDGFQAEIAAAEEAILKAQNGTQLEAAVSSLIEIRGDFLLATNGMRQLHEVRFSIRDLVTQSNHWLAAYYREPNGAWSPGVDPSLVATYLQGYPQSIAPSVSGVPALSDAQFVEYLRARLEPDGSGSSYLRIRFPIGFEPSYAGRTNPLRTNTSSEYGHVIEGPGPSYALKAAVGVFVNIRNNHSINPVGPMPGLASLKPIGNFHTASAPLGLPTKPFTSCKVWNPVETEDASEEKNYAVQVLYNKDTMFSTWYQFPELTLGSAGSQLHERSPANDHWLLEIGTTDDIWDFFMPNMRDIELCMTIRGWAN